MHGQCMGVYLKLMVVSEKLIEMGMAVELKRSPCGGVFRCGKPDDVVFWLDMRMGDAHPA